MDQERNEMARALQHHHDAFNQRHIHDHDDGFENLELNEPPKYHEEIIPINNHHQDLAKTHEKNYEVGEIIAFFFIKTFDCLANLVDE